MNGSRKKKFLVGFMQKNGAFGMNINKMNGNITIKMAKDLKGLESVTTKDAAGNTTVMNGVGLLAPCM